MENTIFALNLSLRRGRNALAERQSNRLILGPSGSSVFFSMRARVARLPKQKIVPRLICQEARKGRAALAPRQPPASLPADARHKDAPIGAKSIIEKYAQTG